MRYIILIWAKGVLPIIVNGYLLLLIDLGVRQPSVGGSFGGILEAEHQFLCCCW